MAKDGIGSAGTTAVSPDNPLFEAVKAGGGYIEDENGNVTGGPDGDGTARTEQERLNQSNNPMGDDSTESEIPDATELFEPANDIADRVTASANDVADRVTAPNFEGALPGPGPTQDKQGKNEGSDPGAAPANAGTGRQSFQDALGLATLLSQSGGNTGPGQAQTPLSSLSQQQMVAGGLVLLIIVAMAMGGSR